MKLSVDFRRLENALAAIGGTKATIGNIRSASSLDRSPIEVSLIEQGDIILSGHDLDEVLHFPPQLEILR